jgi:hypothetical protein
VRGRRIVSFKRRHMKLWTALETPSTKLPHLLKALGMNIKRSSYTSRTVLVQPGYQEQVSENVRSLQVPVRQCEHTTPTAIERLDM